MKLTCRRKWIVCSILAAPLFAWVGLMLIRSMHGGKISQVKLGMNLTEVEAILGKSTRQIRDGKHEFHTWGTGGNVIYVFFTDGAVVEKDEPGSNVIESFVNWMREATGF